MNNKSICSTSCSLQNNKLIAVTALIALAFLVLLALNNWQPFTWQLFGYVYPLPAGLIIIVSLVIGFFAGVSDYLSLNKSGKQDQIKNEWQAQDAKLVASITSDREKQLEAKISTLETALDKALRKE
jgi:uncharacterized integral membrane protein